MEDLKNGKKLSLPISRPLPSIAKGLHDMKTKMHRYKSIKSLGKALGLSDIDIQLIKQKKKVIEKLRKAREKEGLTQSELAKKVGSSQSAVARMESGQVSEVSFDFLARIAFALNTSFRIKNEKAA